MWPGTRFATACGRVSLFERQRLMADWAASVEIRGPVRALRCRSLKVTNPRSSMPSPRASASFTAARKASITSPHSFLVTRGPIAVATCSTRSALVILFSSPEWLLKAALVTL